MGGIKSLTLYIRLPIDLWRINHWIGMAIYLNCETQSDLIASSLLEDVHKPRKSITEMKKDLWYYFKTNIWITSSGDFDTNVFKWVAFCDGHST